MAAVSSFHADDPDTDRADIAACEREIERLRYRPLSPEVLRKIGVELRCLARMTKES